MSVGVAAAAAAQICGDGPQGLSAAGSGQSDALLLKDSLNVIKTSTTGQGVRLLQGLNPGESQDVVNISGNSILVYPPVGGSINGGAQNVGVTLPNNSYTTLKAGSIFGDFYSIASTSAPSSSEPTQVLLQLEQIGGLTSATLTLNQGLLYAGGPTILTLDGGVQFTSDYTVNSTQVTLGAGIIPSRYERAQLLGIGSS